MQECHITVQELANKVGITTGSVYSKAMDRASQICANEANNITKATPFGSHTRHSGLHKQHPQLPKYNDCS